MGFVRSEIERLEAVRETVEEAALQEGSRIEARQAEKMMEVISELRTDQAYLDRLGVQMVNPETGQEILVSDVGLRGVTFVDLQHPRRFGSVTLEYHVDTESYSAVEWRGGEVVESGADPFERQRVNFEDPQEGLKWLAAFFQQRIDIPFGLNIAE